MAKNSRKAARKQTRRDLIAGETRRREDALGVPPERNVFTLNEHFSDEGGPCGLWMKGYNDLADSKHYAYEVWRDRVASAPSGWVVPEVIREVDPEFPTENGSGDFGMLHLELMIFSARAVKALRHLLEPCGTFLPVRSDLGEYVGFRLDAVVDALDVDRTRADWSLGFGLRAKERASSVYSYSFHSDKLAAAMFRVPQHFQILVLKPFVEVFRANSFTGIRFCRVWPSSPGDMWWSHKANWC